MIVVWNRDADSNISRGNDCIINSNREIIYGIDKDSDSGSIGSSVAISSGVGDGNLSVVITWWNEVNGQGVAFDTNPKWCK